jgi:tRNA A-37 threonylcarbamoyl transferase component Bud32
LYIKYLTIFSKFFNFDEGGEAAPPIEASCDSASYDVAPKIYNIDLSNPPSITMEKMDKTVLEVLKDQDGILTDDQQRKILKLYEKLDKIGILHNDANPLNLMIKGDEWRLIDYGMTKKIANTHKENPNLTICLRLLLNSFKGINNKKHMKIPPQILLDALENKCY